MDEGIEYSVSDSDIYFFEGGRIMENKKTNWGLIIGVVIATVAVISAGAFIAVKILKKKKCNCCDELDDADICVLDDDADDISILSADAE